MTYLLFAITSINYIFLNPMLLYLYLLVPLVAWARVRLHHHTPMQTLIGTATAMIICLSLFYLI
jgi:membrane-associated phospholipid phosphatase